MLNRLRVIRCVARNQLISELEYRSSYFLMVFSWTLTVVLDAAAAAGLEAAP